MHTYMQFFMHICIYKNEYVYMYTHTVVYIYLNKYSTAANTYIFLYFSIHVYTDI